MNSHALRHAAWGLLSLLLGACGDGPEALPPGPPPEAVPWVLPRGFDFLPQPESNRLTPEGVALGRWLFHAPRLSGNGQVSCSTCHVQERGFSDGVAHSSAGLMGHSLPRHTPALVNLAWMEGLFWDGGAKNLESLSLAPLTQADEMGQTDLKGMMTGLSADPEVVRRFEAAFGPGAPTLGNLLRGLAQYERTLVSARSRYDRWRRGELGAFLTERESRGLALVRQRCTPCHDSELFTDNAFHNNGLDERFGEGEDVSRGRGRVTLRDEDAGRYKTPTLRNVAVTAPYMHDGRFATLEAVLLHYRGGMVRSSTLDGAFLREGQAPGVTLDDAEAEAVLAFLHTLTDEAFLSDPLLGPPEAP